MINSATDQTGTLGAVTVLNSVSALGRDLLSRSRLAATIRRSRSWRDSLDSAEGRTIQRRSLLALAVVVSSILACAPTAQAVAIEWVTVGDLGNACAPIFSSDPNNLDCFGSVAEDYRISTFEFACARYAELRNAVAATDTNELCLASSSNPCSRPECG